jgi:hypothetical protein
VTTAVVLVVLGLLVAGSFGVSWYRAGRMVVRGSDDAATARRRRAIGEAQGGAQLHQHVNPPGGPTG